MHDDLGGIEGQDEVVDMDEVLLRMEKNNRNPRMRWDGGAGNVKKFVDVLPDGGGIREMTAEEWRKVTLSLREDMKAREGTIKKLEQKLSDAAEIQAEMETILMRGMQLGQELHDVME